MKKICFLLAIFNSLIAVAQAQKTLPSKFEHLVLKNYEVLDFDTSDLNKDKIPDLLLALKLKGEDTMRAEMPCYIKRPLFLYVGTKQGMQLMFRNDDLIFCRYCGGNFDAFEGFSIEKNLIVLPHYGGTSDRWRADYFFAYKGNNKWELAYKKELNYSTHNVDDINEFAPINGAEYEHRDMALFSTYENDLDETWQVTADKSYFYSELNIKAKPRKAYVVKGDKVRVTQVYKNFVQASFTNEKGQWTDSLLLKKNLKLIKKTVASHCG